MSLFLVSALLMLQPSSTEEMASDFSAIGASKTDAILAPALTCVKAAFDAHRVSEIEKGDRTAAASFAKEQLNICGLEQAKLKILAALSQADGAADHTTLRRQADLATGMIWTVSLMRAFEDFEVTSRVSALPSATVAVPCPAELKRRPNHPCFEN